VNELPSPSEVAEVALETLQSALSDPFDALLLLVAVPTSEDGLTTVGVAIVEGLDKAFTARMLDKLAKQYAEEAGVTL
jgi:hypothetical protein